MRVLVCGGRNFDDQLMFNTFMDAVHEKYIVTVIIEGEARGADTMARLWAENRMVECIKFPAKWSEYGKAAGPMRNKQMLDAGRPELVVAFPGGSGTAHMVRIATEAKIPVLEVKT